MQKIEARKWRQNKETFDQYAIEKMTLMHQLNLSESDHVQLLIGGITQGSMRITTLSIAATTVDAFLKKMRYISEGI